MAYEKQQWDTTSYINPTRMNHIEDGIKANSNEIESVANNVIAYGECTTARSTSAKVVSCSGFVLKKGSRIAIRFTDTGNSNPSSGNLTLNVNETGAKTIVDGHANKTILTYANGSYFYNNLVAEFVYDGTYWVYMNRDANTTYTGATLKTGAAKTGSGTTVTDTIAKSTTIDNAIQTLLNNDVAINSNLTELIKFEDITTNINFQNGLNSFPVDVSKAGYKPIGIICWNTSHPSFLYGCGHTINGNIASIYIISNYTSFEGTYSCRVLYIKDINK